MNVELRLQPFNKIHRKGRTMKKVLLPILLIMAITGCDKEKTIVDPGPLENQTIKSGASFGECMGYCWREMDINRTNVTYTKSGWITDEYPPIMITDNITNSEWNGLVELINRETLEAMNEVYGCPDCVDQGAEWIEIVGSDFTKKITFEIGNTLEEIEDLLTEVRTIRERYDDE